MVEWKEHLKQGLVTFHACREQLVAYGEANGIAGNTIHLLIAAIYLFCFVFCTLLYFSLPSRQKSRSAQKSRSDRHWGSIKRALRRPYKCFWTLLTITNLLILLTVGTIAALTYNESPILQQIEPFLSPFVQFKICKTEYIDRHIYHTTKWWIMFTFAIGVYFGTRSSEFIALWNGKLGKKLLNGKLGKNILEKAKLMLKTNGKLGKKILEKAKLMFKTKKISTTLPAHTLLMAELQHEEWEKRKSITNFQENYEVRIQPPLGPSSMEIGPVKLEKPLFPDIEEVVRKKRTKYYIARETGKDNIDLASFGETLIGTAKPIVVIGVNSSGVNAFVDIVAGMQSREPLLCYMAFKDECPDFEAMQKLEELEKTEKIPALFMTCNEIETLYDVLHEHKSAIQQLIRNEDASIVILTEERMKKYVDDSLQALFWRGKSLNVRKENNSLTYLFVEP